MQRENFTKNNKNGFTLVETLVAISILLLVIIGPMTIAQKGIQNAYFANEQIVAVFLAQEAIESIRELRDKDGLDVNDMYPTPGGDAWQWVNGLPGGCTAGNECAFDRYAPSPIVSCGAAHGCVVTKDPATGVYSHDLSGGNIDTIYTRKITISDVTVDKELKVTVEVTWHSNLFGGTRRVKLQTWIYNIYRQFQV